MFSSLGSFPSSPRFDRIRRIGAGAMGVVYEAFDRERNAPVALKVLRLPPSGEFVLRFKNEFRGLLDLEHPNLVRLHELIEHGGQWFFTMELVDGVDFLEYVRPSDRPWTEVPASEMHQASTLPVTSPAAIPPHGSSIVRGRTEQRRQAAPLDTDRLRESLVQLARGLNRLHSAKKIHRDIKPSNILVTRQGRVVLLDFGLATTVDEARGGEVIGTPMYMAPEQAALQAVGPEADWYSVGAVLYQALTDRLPFEGNVMAVLAEKQEVDPPPPCAIVSGVPQDLNELCVQLLQIKSENRPTATDVLRNLGADVGYERRGTPIPVAQHEVFVGRTGELRALTKGFTETREGKGVSIFVYGESGVGKSELIRQFGREIADTSLVLTGRCYERESVPYKAVDGVIDVLSNYLASLPKQEAAGLVPRDASLLLKVFPVLSRVDCLCQAPPVDDTAVHPQELRSRVFAALRELLSRIAHRTALVVLVDDLQWADADSLALLGEITRQPEAPNMLFVASIRSGSDAQVQIELQKKLEAIPEVRNLHIQPLPPEQAEELARRLFQGAEALGVLDAQTIADEAGGHPMFINELVRHSVGGDANVKRFRLDDALKARIDALPEKARVVLDILAVAGRPLSRRTAADASQMDFGDFVRQVEFLRAEHLAKTAGTRQDDVVETYHDRVREVVQHYAGNQLVSYSERLAVAYENAPNPDAETLFDFWKAADQLAKAARYGEQAGDEASAALAFDRSIRLYRTAIESQPNPSPALWAKLAQALANARHGLDAATAFQHAASLSSEPDATEYVQRAAEQLLRSGHIDSGLEAMRPMLSANDLPMPKRPLLAFLARRAWMRLTNPKLEFNRVASDAQDPSALKRMDLCWSAAMGLFTADQILGLNYHHKHLQLALKAGDALRVGKGLALEAVIGSCIGMAPAKISGLLQSAAGLATELGDAYLSGVTNMAAGIVAFLSGEWQEALDHSRKAEAIFRESCRGTSIEIESLRQNARCSLYFLGRIDELQSEVENSLAEAKTRGDLYAAMSCRSGLPNLRWLMQDDADGAAQEALNAIREWSQDGFHLQHFFDLVARVHIALYRGDAMSAAKTVVSNVNNVERAGLLKLQLNDVLFNELSSRAYIAAYLHTKDPSLLRKAERSARSLGRVKRPWAQAHHAMAVAHLHLIDDDVERAQQGFELAHVRFTESGMLLHADIASGCLAKVQNNVDLINGLIESLTAQGVRSPLKFARLLAPALEST